VARRGRRGAAAHAVIGVENQGKRYRSRKSKQASHSSLSIGKSGCGEATFDGVRLSAKEDMSSGMFSIEDISNPSNPCIMLALVGLGGDDERENKFN